MGFLGNPNLGIAGQVSRNPYLERLLAYLAPYMTYKKSHGKTGSLRASQ